MSSKVIADVENDTESPRSSRSWQAALSLSWLGQMIASGCWIVSVFAYGVASLGDVMQLIAASAWMVANVASLYESAT